MVHAWLRAGSVMTDAGSDRTHALLQVEGVSKAFGGTQALDHVSLRVMPGQVHGLVGQNGCGKSTLVKVLSGYHMPDEGARIVVDGSEVSLGAGRSRSLGLRFVHQDLGVIPQLSVTENLFADRYATQRQTALRWHVEYANAAALLSSFGVDVDPRRPMGELPAATQAMVVIVRAAEGLRQGLAGEDRRGILILDEATASLPLVARSKLRAVVQEVVGHGHGVLFVSHFPDEVLDWADYVTVFRDGRVVAAQATEGMSEDHLVELIIGRKLQVASVTNGAGGASSGDAPVLSVAGLRGTEIRDLSFVVRPGEVLGITGLVGSGYDEVCRVLGGAISATAGTLAISGHQWDLSDFSPVLARRAGISFVPSDRQHEGGAPALTVAENISLPILQDHRGRGDRIKHRQLRREVAHLLYEYNVQPPDPGISLQSLSGGNQQKVVIAKAMAGSPTVLALVEPTQGVDVGARADILGKLKEVARRGTAVVCATADATQLEQFCDRVIVLQRGLITAELSGFELNEGRIVEETYRSVA